MIPINFLHVFFKSFLKLKPPIPKITNQRSANDFKGITNPQTRYPYIHTLSQDWKQGVQQHTITYYMAP
jgi:hypothetical protein